MLQDGHFADDTVMCDIFFICSKKNSYHFWSEASLRSGLQPQNYDEKRHMHVFQSLSFTRGAVLYSQSPPISTIALTSSL